MTEEGGNKVTSAARAWPLYGAAFATAVALSICWTAMPFVLTGINGTAAHVGYALAANSLAYMAALLLTGSLLGHLNVKRATCLATAVALGAALAMLLAVSASMRQDDAGQLTWVWAIIVAGGLGGASMALYWPFLMSWVSARYEGVELNRRFGRYNGAWSGGALIGPTVGAWLVGIDPRWPMVGAVVCFAAGLVLLAFGRSSSGRVVATVPPDEEKCTVLDARLLADYRWMSRVTLFCAWATQSIARSQFALLFVHLGNSEAQFGLFMTTFAACNFLALVMAGRWAFWHFKPAPLIVAHAMLLAPLLMMIYGRTLPVFFASAIILGLAFGFAYSSHLYYGAATSRQRSVRMVIHEMVISLGITVGAGTGGYLGKNVGAYAPYWFAVALVGLGIVVQLAIHCASRVLIARHGRAVDS